MKYYKTLFTVYLKVNKEGVINYFAVISSIQYNEFRIIIFLKGVYMLTTRMKKAMTLILKADGYITLKHIADKIGVSTRTLLRELDSLEQWISIHDGQLIKKKGSGLKVSGDSGEKDRLLNLLEASESEVILSPIQRSVIIRGELLKAEEPLKLYSLATELDVVESTISGDLLSIESWFEGYGLTLVRRQGLGVLLKGNEKARRKAIVSLLYDQIPIIDFMDFIRLEKQSVKTSDDIRRRINKSLFGLLDIDHIHTVAMLIKNIGLEMGFSYADNAFMALTLRFCVTLKRQDHWGQQLLDYKERDALKKDPVYKAFRHGLEDHKGTLFLEMPEEELLYLVMHIKGSKRREAKYDSRISMIEDFKIIQLAKEFVLAVEEETGIYLSDNEELIFGLVKHLRPAIYRMKMELDFINPLMMEIKAMYPKLFIAIRKCASLIESKEGVIVPDDEIAYLATHIGAVIQKEDRDVIKKFQVVVACMYGIGASQLLLANIKRNFRNIDIVNVVSVMDYKLNPVDFQEVDLIISTLEMDTGDIPCIVVNPLINQEDVQKITGFLRNFKSRHVEYGDMASIHFREKLLNLQAYNDILLKITEHFEYDHDIAVKDMAGVIEYASGSIAKDHSEKQLIKEAFVVREEKGSTILSKKGMLLLHCRADVACMVSLKMFQLKAPIMIDHNGEQQPITTIVVMIGPSSMNQKVLDVLSEISRCIITSDFAELILKGENQKVERELHRILDAYYQKLVTSA